MNDKEFNDTRKEVVSELKDKMPFINKTINKMYNANEKPVNTSDTITLPVDSKKYIGKSFIDVEKKLLALGFNPENISFVKIERGRKGFFQKEGEVVDVLFDGLSDVAKGYKFGKDTKIVIKYAVYGYTTL